jgi:hypothetical protein
MMDDAPQGGSFVFVFVFFALRPHLFVLVQPSQRHFGANEQSTKLIKIDIKGFVFAKVD